MSNENGIERRKIVVAGLDNAGKTTILALIRKKMVDSSLIKPTRGISRAEVEILGKNVALHDFGGQKVYRDSYFKDKRFLEATDAFIFVIDLQDIERYDLALEYFDRALGEFAKHGISPMVFIFYHKYDHHYQEKHQEEDERIIRTFENLTNKIEATCKRNGMALSGTFTTSVYNEWSCFSSFHEVWVSLYSQFGSVQEYLSELCEKIPEAKMILLLDKDGNLIAKKISGTSTGISLEKLQAISGSSIILMNEWTKSGIYDQDEPVASATMKVKESTVMVQKVPAGEEEYYLVILTESGNYEPFKQTIVSISNFLGVFLAKLK